MEIIQSIQIICVWSSKNNLQWSKRTVQLTDKYFEAKSIFQSGLQI